MGRGGTHLCAGINCGKSKAKFPDVTFFRFPKCPKRSKRWVINTRRADLLKKPSVYLNNNCCLCADHFEPSMFMNLQEKKSLVWDAVPTLFDIPNPPKRIESQRRLLKRTLPPEPTPKTKVARGSRKDSALSASQSDVKDVDQNLRASMDTAKPNNKNVSRGTNDDSTADNQSVANCVNLHSYASIETTNQQYFPQSTSSTEAQQDYGKEIKRLEGKIATLQNKLLLSRKKIRSEKVTTSRLRKRLMAPPKNEKADVLSFVSQNCCGMIKPFLLAQIDMIGVSKQGRRWSDDIKHMALAFYFQSPKLYSFLSKMLNLPSKATLAKWVHHLKVEPGLCENVFTLLKQTAGGMSEQEKIVALCVDEMSLNAESNNNTHGEELFDFETIGHKQSNKEADFATVFFIRGIQSTIKQPICYNFCNEAMSMESLKNLTIKCIENLENAGFYVLLVITDQGSKFVKLFEAMNVSKSQPCFHHNNKTYFVMFDPPHLLKSLRDILKLYDIGFNDKTASWNHIQQFHRKDSKQTFRTAPKLTARHLALSGSSNESVLLAAQTLSDSVAVGILKMVSNGMLPQDAKDTAYFVEKCNLLFECFNSKAAFHGHQKSIDFLKDVYESFENVRVFKKETRDEVKTNINCFDGWQITIMSLVQMCNILKNTFDLKYVIRKHLNLDPLANFFSAIRRRSGHKKSPSPNQFQNVFKISALNSLLANCNPDSDEFLNSFTNLCSKLSSSVQKDTLESPARAGEQHVNSVAIEPLSDTLEMMVA